ncbi:MAG: SdrD B-like domain-containing protein [Caldilineaceae bacterium]
MAGPDSVDCQSATYLNARPLLQAQRRAWIDAAGIAIPDGVAMRSEILGSSGAAVDAPLTLQQPDGFAITLTPVDLPANLGFNSGSNATGIPAFANVQINGGANGCTMQDRAPRPASAVAGDYYFNQLSNLNGLNAIHISFSEPVLAFGAFVGDLETSARGTTAFMRLLDASGALIADVPVSSTLSLQGGIAAEDAQCDQGVDGANVAAQGLTPGCGNGSTRWMGFVSETPVAQMVIAMGDNDPLPGGLGLTEKLSLMGPTVVRVLPPAEVMVLKEAPYVVTEGALYNYAIVISNTSNSMAAGLVITDAAPPGISFAAVSDSRCTLTTSLMVCQMETLAANSAATILLQATASSSETLTNTVTIAAANDGNFTNNSADAAVTPNPAPPIDLCAPPSSSSGGPALIINEVLYNELGANNDEWVELYATTDIPSGAQFYISDNEQNAGEYALLFEAPTGGIPAGTYIVIHDDRGVDDLDPSDGVMHLWGAGGPGAAAVSLRNSSDNITLYQGSSAIAANAIDYMRWGSAVADTTNDDPPVGILWSGFAPGTAGNAQSVVRLVDGVDGSSGADWVLAGEQGTVAPATPGGHNSGLSLCNVGVTKTGPTSVPTGDPFEYLFTVRNTSNITMSAIILTDTQPVGIVFQSVVGAGCHLESDELVCAIGALAPQASQQITVTAVATTARSITNSVIIAANGDSVAADNRASHTLSAQSAGAIGDYVFLDVNENGVLDADENLPINGVPITLTAADDSMTTLTTVDGIYQFENLPTGLYTVTVGSVAGYRRTSAGTYTIALAQGQTFIEADFGFVYESVDLSVTKQAAPTTTLGSALVYTLAVANPSFSTPALDVLLIDNPPTGIELTGVADQRCGLVQGVLNCNLGVVAPLATETISITARAIAGGNWTNTAQISGVNETGGANNTASANTTVTTDSPAPQLALQKVLLAPSSGVARPGDTILFALQIENRGAITVSEIALVDRYDPAYLQYESASIPPTAQATGVLTWTLSAAPLPLAPGATMTVTVAFMAVQP